MRIEYPPDMGNQFNKYPNMYIITKPKKKKGTTYKNSPIMGERVPKNDIRFHAQYIPQNVPSKKDMINDIPSNPIVHGRAEPIS